MENRTAVGNRKAVLNQKNKVIRFGDTVPHYHMELTQKNRTFGHMAPKKILSRGDHQVFHKVPWTYFF